VEGKIGRALSFTGVAQFLLGDDDVSERCLGDLRRCRHGITVSMWLRFSAAAVQTQNRSRDRAPVFDSGHHGLTVVYADRQLAATATAGQRQWTVSQFAALLAA